MNNELLLLLALAIIISVAKLAGHLSRRYGRQPVVFGELLAGLLLGPTVLNLFAWPFFATGAPWLHETIKTLANIGVLLLMFIAGLETDLSLVRRVGKVALAAAVGGVLLPLVGGALAALAFGLSSIDAIFIGVVLTATSVSISAQTLMELNQLCSREGATIMGAAVIDDVLGIIVLSVFIAFAAPQVAAQQTLVGMLAGPGVVGKLLLTLLFMALFFTLAIWFGARAFRAVFAAAERLHASHAIPATALLLLLLFAFGAVYLGQVAAITGAYIAGVFIARTPYRERVEHGIHPFTYAFFVPIFFISIGLEANARALQGGNWLFVLVIVLVAILTKIAGCGLGARMTGFTRPAALRVGLGMISRGEVGLIIALIGRDAGLLSTNAYATMVIMVLVTTMVTPLFLRVSFPPAAPNATEVYECVIGMETSEDTEGL